MQSLSEKVRLYRAEGFSHIDGRPRFAKHSFNDDKKVKIAAIDPDFESRLQPLSLMEFAGRCLYSLTSFYAPCVK
jgi:hypothetical protein